MKHATKLVSLYLFAAFGLALQSCGPETEITGMVREDQADTPVPGAAVLGMVWIEDADKAKPALTTDGLNIEDRNAAYEKDATERGLPVAYARTFTDEKGWFTLDRLHFSGETKKVVKAMRQPRITRVTLCAFQRGYLKGALTAFPKDEKELPGAVILLSKPKNWKELSRDSSFSSLERPEYYNGYSKEFGATKREKNWFLEYTHSNLYKAYTDSDIKGHKEWESYCGHDYSDIIISTAGMYRNPAHEKCAELLKRMGDVRANEKYWADHFFKGDEWVETAKETVKEAIAGLGAETGEPKEYEREILGGMEAGNRNRKETDPVNWVEESKTKLEEAKILYGKGDKAAAYGVLGQAIHARMRTAPDNITATVLIPAVQDAVAGFYQLMNKPLTAQLPGSDKPVEKAEVKKQEPEPTKIRLGMDEVDVGEIHGRIGIKISETDAAEEFEGNKAWRNIVKTVYHTPSTGYFLKVENHLLKTEESDGYDAVKAHLELYTASGTKVLDKDLIGGRVLYADVLQNGIFWVAVEPWDVFPSSYSKQEIYNSRGEVLYESQSINTLAASPQADYLLLLEKAADGMALKKLDLRGDLKVLTKMSGDMLEIKGISDNGYYFFITDASEIVKTAPSGKKYWRINIMYFSDAKLLWTKSLEAEGFSWSALSRNGKYVLIAYETDYTCREIKDGLKTYRTCNKWVEHFKVLNASTRETVYDGLRDEKLIQEYKDEIVNIQQRQETK